MTGKPSTPAHLAPMTAADEQALVTGMAQGDRGSVALFFERTHHPVYCMAIRMTRDPELRRDWTHDVLMGVLEDVQRGRFVWRRPGSFWAWFGRRAWFRLLDCHRRHRRRSSHEQPLDAERPGARNGAPSSAPEAGFDPPIFAQLELVEMTASVESCLEQLPNQLHRRALRLLLFDELPYEAIAEQLEAPLNTVRAWIRRGRLQLRVCVARALGVDILAEDDA